MQGEPEFGKLTLLNGFDGLNQSDKYLFVSFCSAGISEAVESAHRTCNLFSIPLGHHKNLCRRFQGQEHSYQSSYFEHISSADQHNDGILQQRSNA